MSGINISLILEVDQVELMKNRPQQDKSKLTGLAFGPSYQLKDSWPKYPDTAWVKMGHAVATVTRSAAWRSAGHVEHCIDNQVTIFLTESAILHPTYVLRIHLFA